MDAARVGGFRLNRLRLRDLWWGLPLATLSGSMPWVATGSVPLLAAVQAMTPFVAAGTLLLAVLVMWRRRWLGATVLLTAVVICMVPLLGLTTFAHAASRAITARGFSVLALNCEVASADAAHIRELMSSQNPAAVVLVEVDEFLIADVLSPSLKSTYRYRTQTVASDGITGSVILSRFPLTEGAGVTGTQFQNPVATLDLGAAGPLTVAAVHAFPPIDGTGAWHRELRTLKALQSSLGQPAVMVGDFNATAAHPEFRALLTTMTDAGAPVGRYPAPTWPATLPLLSIDHVLHSPGLKVQQFTTIAVPGTDHKATLTTFR